jgi:hypothetical protein
MIQQELNTRATMMTLVPPGGKNAYNFEEIKSGKN